MEVPLGMDRPIKDKRLARALRDVQKVLDRQDYAGYVTLISSEEMAWTYNLATSWSAIYPEPGSYFGIRVRATPSRVPEDEEKLRQALWIFVSMLRGGDMLQHMALSFIKMMEDRGLEVDYNRFVPPNIIGLDNKQNQ